MSFASRGKTSQKLYKAPSAEQEEDNEEKKWPFRLFILDNRLWYWRLFLAALLLKNPGIILVIQVISIGKHLILLFPSSHADD